MAVRSDSVFLLAIFFLQTRSFRQLTLETSWRSVDELRQQNDFDSQSLCHFHRLSFVIAAVAPVRMPVANRIESGETKEDYDFAGGSACGQCALAESREVGVSAVARPTDRRPHIGAPTGSSGG